MNKRYQDYVIKNGVFIGEFDKMGSFLNCVGRS